MRIFLYIITLLLLQNASAVDIESGEELFNEAACMDCHNSVDFKKDAKKISNLKKLHTSVQACQISNDVAWFDEDTEDVTEYLNQKYYKFSR